jgi:hypothetical protein
LNQNAIWWRRGWMFITYIESDVDAYNEVEDVVEHVENVVHFEIDSVALYRDLKDLGLHEKIVLRDDCVIERVG